MISTMTYRTRLRRSRPWHDDPLSIGLRVNITQRFIRLSPPEFNFFFFQAEDGIRYLTETGVQTCALPIFRAQSGDVEVVSTDKPQVLISVSEAPAEEVALYAFGDRVEPSFRGRRTLRRGKLRVELPKGRDRKSVV